MLRNQNLALWNIYLEILHAEKRRQPITKQSFRYTIVFASTQRVFYRVTNNCFESENFISYGTASKYSLPAQHILKHE